MLQMIVHEEREVMIEDYYYLSQILISLNIIIFQKKNFYYNLG